MTDTHVIQKRDLLEMLKPFPDNFQIKAVTENGLTSFFDKAIQRDGKILVQTVGGSSNDRMDEMDEEIKSLERSIQEANDLISNSDYTGYSKDQLIGLVKEIYNVLPATSA